MRRHRDLYPILIYFRFGVARYAIARKTLIVFDAASLIRTALDGEHYASFIPSATVNGCGTAACS